MISKESIATLNSARANSLVDADYRRLTASSRTGASFAKGDKISPVGGLLPELLPIGDAANPSGWYLGYTLDADKGNLSYKALFGKRVVATPAANAKLQDSGYTFNFNGTEVKVVLIKRDEFKPRTTGTLRVDQMDANGKVVPVFQNGQQLTVDVLPKAYITCMPNGLDRHPDGMYYAHEVSNYPVFKA